MKEIVISNMIQKLADQGIISRWCQDDFDGTFIIEEWNITNGKEFEKASAFVHFIKEASCTIDCCAGDCEIDCSIPNDESVYNIEVIVPCVWL